jgi:flavin reductase (DIM6/NTAB) family NADH-FMN oxidoreductase RutF
MELSFDSYGIKKMEDRKRRAFINSLSGFKSLNLIGTKNRDGQTNLAIFNSVFHLGANPALMGFIVRPDSVDRHTLSNILETSYYTINHVNKHIYKEAHQTSARYDTSVSEFDATHLTTEYKMNFSAPFVKESVIKMGLQFKQRIDIELNGTIIIAGEIQHVHCPKQCLAEDGFLNIERAESIAGIGLDSYHTTQAIERLSYAKSDKELTPIISNYSE